MKACQDETNVRTISSCTNWIPNRPKDAIIGMNGFTASVSKICGIQDVFHALVLFC